MIIGAHPPIPDQDLLGDGRDVLTRGREDMSQREASGSRHMVTGEVVKMPFVGTQRPVEPDRVVEADAVDVLALEPTADHGRLSNRVRREVIGGVGEPIPMNERVLS